jgi:hypothetical protein
LITNRIKKARKCGLFLLAELRYGLDNSGNADQNGRDVAPRKLKIFSFGHPSTTRQPPVCPNSLSFVLTDSGL